MRFFLILTLLIPIFLGSCSNPKTSAIKQLEQNQYRFTTEDFLFAASTGDLPTLVLFGKAGINVNALGANGRTALMEAARKGKFEAVELLLSAGADPRIVDSRGRDALIAAAAGGYTEVGRVLLSRGADSKVRDTDGWTGLSLAAYKGMAEMVRLLAGQAAQKNLDEALLLASFNGDKDTVSNLLSQGAFIDTKSPERLTPLMIASKTGNYEATGFLLHNKANLLSMDSNGKTASHLAKEAGHHHICQLIMDGGLGNRVDEEILKAATQGDQLQVREGNEKPLVALNGSKIRTRSSKVEALSSFELSNYKERNLPVALKDVDGVYAIISRRDPTGIITDVKITAGELIPGTEYRLQEIEPNKIRSNGLPETTIDTERVRIQNVKTGANHLLVKEEKGLPIDAYAILTSNSSNFRYVAKTGDIFQTVDPNFGERDFQVVAVRETEVAVKELSSRKVYKMNRNL